MTPFRSPPTRSGNGRGKQIQDGVGLWRSAPTQTDGKSSSGLARSLGAAGCRTFGALPVPKAAVRPPQPASRCFPHASPVSEAGAGKQKTASEGRSKRLTSLMKFGAGEGIRTLDPNLGKVVSRDCCRLLGLVAV